MPRIHCPSLLRERAAQSTAGLHCGQRLLREVLGWPDLQPCSGWAEGLNVMTLRRELSSSVVLLLPRCDNLPLVLPEPQTS